MKTEARVWTWNLEEWTVSVLEDMKGTCVRKVMKYHSSRLINKSITMITNQQCLHIFALKLVYLLINNVKIIVFHSKFVSYHHQQFQVCEFVLFVKCVNK